MDGELLKAMMIIYHYCLEQDDCRTCSLRDFCHKMPCEW